jgi:hypothetical protein
MWAFRNRFGQLTISLVLGSHGPARWNEDFVGYLFLVAASASTYEGISIENARAATGRGLQRKLPKIDDKICKPAPGAVQRCILQPGSFSGFHFGSGVEDRPQTSKGSVLKETEGPGIQWGTSYAWKA